MSLLGIISVITLLGVRRVFQAVLAYVTCYDVVSILATVVVLQFLVSQLFNKSFRNRFDSQLFNKSFRNRFVLFILNPVLCARVVLQAILALARCTFCLVVLVLATFIVTQLQVTQFFNKRCRNRFNLLFLLLICIRAILQTFLASLIFPTRHFIVRVLAIVV